MKKILLLLFAGVLMNPANAEAESCGREEYWNSIEKKCKWCSSCSTCSEHIFRCNYWSDDLCSIRNCLTCPRYAKLADGLHGEKYCLSCRAGSYLGKYKGDDTCFSCPEGTYTRSENIQSSCTPCPAGTWSESGASSCNACSDIPVKNGTCTSCSSTGTCSAISCNSGYTLSNGKCVNGSESESESGGDSSSTCGNGYVLIDGVCEAVCQSQVNLTGGVCEKYCAGTVGSSSQLRRVCLYAKCFDGSEPKSTKATYMGENIPHRYCCPENCLDCSDWGQCTSCNDGYTLTNGSCVMAAPSCTDGQYADSTGKCQLCSNISVTNVTCSACSSDGTCTNATCDKGYAYNASTSACTPVVTCKPPLKFSADYSGDCDGCCVE